MKARLMARGFEEVEEVEKDSQTVSKSTMRILGKQETNKFCYIGFGIDQNHKEITLDQGKYVTDLQGIRIDPG